MRVAGRDATGNPVRPFAAKGDEPLRCCLRMPHAGVLRGYDHDGRIADHGIAALLDDPRIVMVQRRNVMSGCYMFAVQR